MRERNRKRTEVRGTGRLGRALDVCHIYLESRTSRRDREEGGRSLEDSRGGFPPSDYPMTL